MSRERILGRRAQAGLRVGAALLAAQMSLGMDREAHADINKPVRYPLADGRLLADAPLRTAGRAVDFTGPHGLEFCGTSTTEPTILTVVADEDLMNLKVIGNPDVFVDPEDLGGFDYLSRAASAVEALQSKATELINRTNRLWRRIAVILTRDAVNQDVCDLIADSGPFAEAAPPDQTAATQAKAQAEAAARAAADAQAQAQARAAAEAAARAAVTVPPVKAPGVEVRAAAEYPTFRFAVPARHVDVPVANVNTHGGWIRPIYNQLEATAAANWRGIGPWAPIAFAAEPNAAHLKSYGNLGEFVIVGDNGGRVWVGVWQQAQHQHETKLRHDGALDPNWRNQYTFKGLPPGTEVIPYDPDTGTQLRWPDGTPIRWAANHLGTFSVELQPGEVRVAFCMQVAGQRPGEQPPEVLVTRGPNDQPGLTGENKLPETSQVIKPFMPD